MERYRVEKGGVMLTIRGTMHGYVLKIFAGQPLPFVDHPVPVRILSLKTVYLEKEEVRGDFSAAIHGTFDGTKLTISAHQPVISLKEEVPVIIIFMEDTLSADRKFEIMREIHLTDEEIERDLGFMFGKKPLTGGEKYKQGIMDIDSLDLEVDYRSYGQQ